MRHVILVDIYRQQQLVLLGRDVQDVFNKFSTGTRRIMLFPQFLKRPQLTVFCLAHLNKFGPTRDVLFSGYQIRAFYAWCYLQWFVS